MGASSSKPADSHLAGRDPARTAAAQALANTHAAVLTSIKIDGSVVLASNDEAYQELRSSAFSYNDCGYPSVIFLPKHAQDVSTIIKAIAPLQLDLAIACGKHSAICLPDNAIVIDLLHLNGVTVNKDERWIDVGGGAKLGVADQALAGSGLGFVTGTNPDTGVGGLTQAGGWGWLARQHGMAVDHWLEADVVLATGELVSVNDTNDHKDLMRALRGGAGNFGVVTRFRFALHPVDKCDYGILVRMSPTKTAATNTVHAFVRHMKDAPSFASGMVILPCGAPVVVNVVTAVGSKEVVKDSTWIKGARRLQGPWFSPMNKIKTDGDYNMGLQPVLAAFTQRGFALSTSYFVKEMNDAMVDVLIHFTRVQIPSKKAAIMAACLGGAIAKGIPERPHAMSHRENGWWLVIEAMGPDMEPETVARHKQWVADLKAAIIAVDSSVAQASHVFFDTKGQEGSTTTAYDSATKQFLRQIKTQYDPANVFHMNHNILPLE
ncbi:Aste57867_19222 [Aphanomyces stellatus]|uniref:Aste57867_15739 protein n=1 Tax=Aphanomyces stellatus TaxID=120398 RepID=A0A485LCV8_9STRA|nr:hypothetical protein As57867_019158 [Aphanomyces stellatus]KAF0693262.1 hypothetical protein As57867_015683 [Aphanomyces stellatus]VFT92528.1 Aste57867_15739 [Aphanomyces stellatus]VFT95943.1 Aste57867_19222 [Aphanomyces stellatus]